MYKLLLCFRYLRSKIIAYLAIGGVMLCVFMMLVSVSVMTSFLDKIEKAAKGLFGDIVMEPHTTKGMAHYDEFIGMVKQELPDVVEEASPFILTFGMLRLSGDPDYRQSIQVAGIRLPERTGVTDFEHGLFIQKDDLNATFDPAITTVQNKIIEDAKKVEEIAKRNNLNDPASPLSPDQRHLLRQINNARHFQNAGYSALLTYDPQLHLNIERKKKEIEELEQQGASETTLDPLREELDRLDNQRLVQEPAYRAIPGLGIPGLSHRTRKNEVIRILSPGNEIILYVAPLGQNMSHKHIEPEIHKFTIIDDHCSGVSSIDDNIVYIPFTTAQLMNRMDAGSNADGLGRCNQIHIKVKNPDIDELQLRAVAEKIRGVWDRFQTRYPASASAMEIKTWRERQVRVVAPLEGQRVLIIIIISIMSGVAVVLVFVILYTIVVQKTREIGILKAVGASNAGVAGLYFMYGGAISFVGSILGTLLGWYVTGRINEIHDWVGDVFGIRIFSRETHMFAVIPDDVDWNAAVYIVIGTILSGLIGALLPAVRAAKMQPVEALRYE